VSQVLRQVSCDRQLLPLGTEYHLMEFQHCLVVQPELKHTQPQPLTECVNSFISYIAVQLVTVLDNVLIGLFRTLQTSTVHTVITLL